MRLSYYTPCPEKRDWQYFGRNFDKFTEFTVILCNLVIWILKKCMDLVLVFGSASVILYNNSRKMSVIIWK